MKFNPKTANISEVVDTSIRESIIEEEYILMLVKEQMFGGRMCGVCILCGEERDGCEPDARGYECYNCGEKAVFGAEEMLCYL